MTDLGSSGMLTINVGTGNKIDSIWIFAGRNSTGSSASQFGHGGFSTDSTSWSEISALSAKGYDKGSKIKVKPSGNYQYYVFGRGNIGETDPSPNAETRIYKLIVAYSAVGAASEWQVKGLDDVNWAGFNMTGTETVSVSRLLEAKHEYKFKLYNTSTSKWWGNGTTYQMTQGQTIEQADAGANCKLRTSKAGTYTFSFNTSTKVLTVIYPDDYKGYWTKNGASWSKVYAYCYMDGDDSWRNAEWPGVEITSQTEDICGTHYYINTSGYTTVIFNNGSSGEGNQTGNIAISGGEGKHAVGAAATGWTAYPTYTVTYDGNENTGGSVPTDSNSPYACGSTVTVLGNTGSLVRTGYNFTGWNTEANGSGTGYTAGKTFTISANTTLYAQWELIPTYDITYNANEGTGTTASQTGNLSGAVVATRANGFTRSGYKFKWWNTKADGSGEDFYPGEKVTIASSNVTLYAQWEQVADNQEFWTPIDEAEKVTGVAISKTAGDMSITSGGATDAADINVDVNTSTCVVNKYNSSVDKHAKVLAIKNTDKYIDVHFTDGSPINKLWFGATTNQSSAQNIVVVYSATSDFTTAGGAAHEFKQVGSTANLVQLPANTQATKYVTDVSPSTENTYYYARIYRRITTANSVFDNAANLGSDKTIRIYSIKAQKGVSCVAPTAVNISGTYHCFPGETISLTATPTGGSGTLTMYQWYKGGTADGNIIEGATSATYSKANCTFADTGSYYCKVTRGGSCSTFSNKYDVKILRLYVKGSKNGEDYGNVDFVKVDETTATASISLRSGWTYGFNIADGCGHYYGNAGTMTKNNCTNWVTNVDGTDCGLTTTNAATYIFTINYSNLSMITTSVTFPVANQAAGKVIYFDNNVLKWTGNSIYYRIGHASHSQADQLSLVPGTANLYKMTTREYNGFSAWQIGNAEGGNGSEKSIYNTKNTPAITASIAYEGEAVTADAVTVTPSSSHARGTSSDNDNCDFYEYGQQEGMKTQNVSITAPSNGTIRVAYTDVEGASQSFTSGSADLAHTVIITPTATPNTGYTLSGLTVNEAAHTSGNTYTVTTNTTIAATFSPIQVSSISVDPSSKTLEVGGTQQLTATVSPDNAFDKAVTWSTSNSSVATVSSTGLVTAVAPGSCTITATAHDGSGKTGTCSITVNKITPTKYSISVDKTTLCGGETATLTLAGSEDGVTYELRKNSTTPIAETQKTGTGSALTWTGLSTGDYVVYAVETATYSERQMEGSKITVTAATATSITTQPTNQEVTVGEKATLKVVAAGTSLSYQWQESATEGGTYTNVASDGKSASYTVTPAAAGTKWYKCVVTGDCGEATSNKVSIVAAAADPLVSWTMNLNTATWGAASTSNHGNTEITSITTSCNAGGEKASSNVTAKVSMAKAEVTTLAAPTSSANFTFTLASGDKIVPKKIKCEVFNVSGGERTYKAQIRDDNSHVYNSTNTLAVSSEATLTPATFNFASDLELKGNITLKIYAWDTDDSKNPTEFRMGRDIKFYGEIETVCIDVTAPTALTCSAHTSSSLTFTWTKAANASGYTASLYNNSGCTGDPAASQDLGDVATVTFSTLSAETTYYCMVQSHGDGSTYCADGGTTAEQSGITDAADVTAPTFVSSVPTDEATGVDVSGNIVLTFSENVTIVDASKFTLTGGAGTLHTASASASGAVVTIPYSGLAYNTTYTLATAAEAVKDGSNNKNAALSDITFTTLSATGSCNEQNYVWQTGSSYTPKGVSHTYADGDVAMINNEEAATTNITISGTNYAQKDGNKGSLNLAKAKNNYFLLTAASGYVIDSVYFYGKLEDGACRMSTDGSAWTTTLGDGSSIGEKVYAIGVGTQYFGLMNNDEDSPAGVWIRTMMVKVCPAGTTYTVNYDANGHGAAPDAKTGITPGSTISEPSAPTADCWTFNGWYKERACTNVWNFAEDEVHSNITLYAKWTSNKARVKGLYYGETDYTVTPDGTGDAITVTPVNASGVTYKWYSNTSDDVTGWREIPSAETASYAPSIDEAGTKYYWAVLVHDCGNDTTSSVRINVAATKTEPTIAWGNVQLSGDETTPTYGGGGYTLTGTINAGNGATPTLATDMISADGGIVITDKSVNDASKTFSLTFDMTAAFDTTQAKITQIHFSLPSNATYNDSVFSTNLSFDKCSGGSYSTDVYVVGYTNATGTSISSSADHKALKVTKSWISTASPSFTDKTSTDGFSISATNANFYWKQSNQTIISTTTGATMTMYKVGKKSCTIEWTNSSLSFSKVRIIGRNESADPSTVTVSNGTEEKTFTFAGGKQGELQIQEVSMEFVHGSKKGVRVKGDGAKEISAIIELVPTGSDGAGTGTPTTLQWKSGKAPSDISGWDGSAKKIVKAQSDDGFTCVAEQTSATNSVGAITYASDNIGVATVNETTGEVDIVAGAAGGEATITATMARSGCFMRSTISYTISVAELACAIEPGTLTASATSKCTTATVTLTLSDYTSTGTTISWYKSGTAEPLTNGGTYTINGATLTTTQEGTYYAKVTLTETDCALSSNNVTITNKGGAASVSKLVNQWYIKKGRVTPDIALWRLGEGSSYVANSAKADGVTLTDQLGGCTVIARDSTIYLSGGDPTGISAVGDVSLTVQVQDECGNTTTSDPITIHKQVATDKHELAFVTIGTNYKEQEFTEDAWTAGIKAANSTGLALYQVLKDTFKIQATNIYASDDEKKLREYYSQFDIICITDYPNTSTKGKNSKSYVDAIGSLIDIRPVLTMEAWVSGLDNWRNKGAVGTRTTPSKRQYNMYLQCKDHEIFEGVTMQQIGYGDDAIFKVNMVDSTQSRYAQLDAVGKDRYAEDTAALQGFTTGDMDLLAIGLIDNGSGTNLQVGAERQNVMTARMMILGVNSYAMERLSEDGMRVIVNALQYLTKKRVEDISDCSTYFTNAAGDNRWDNPANWRSGTLPYSNQEVRILQPVVVNDTRKIASVKIVADGTFQDEEARGHLTIAPTGALIVNSMIQSATGPDVFSGYPTEISHLTIQTGELHQGALIFDNSNGATQATVSLYSKAYNDGSYKFQYFASPFMELSSWAFDAYIYTHNESLDVEWTELRYGEDVSAFQGLAITADGAARHYTIDGTLVSTNPHTFNLTYTSGKANNKKGSNVIGNSWSAPIQITRIDDSDFSSPSNFEGIIYIYNAGRDVLVDGKVHASDGNSEPGQWQSIPLNLAKTEEWEHKRQIPAFQAFQMKVKAATEFTLDYNKHVRQEASVGVNNYNEPLHAPSRSMRAEEIKVLRLCVEDAQVGKSYIYLCEGDEFTEERDRGWEAKQTVGSGQYGKLYAIDQARDYMMSIARPSLEGTPVGFICGQSTEYTISFNETDGTYYLNDLEKQQSTLIQEGESYTFTTTKGNHPNRFIISATPFEAPSVATGMTNLDAAAPKVQKIIYNDKLYIIRGGKVYSADGQVVK